MIAWQTTVDRLIRKGNSTTSEEEKRTCFAAVMNILSKQGVDLGGMLMKAAPSETELSEEARAARERDEATAQAARQADPGRIRALAKEVAQLKTALADAGQKAMRLETKWLEAYNELQAVKLELACEKKIRSALEGQRTERGPAPMEDREPMTKWRKLDNQYEGVRCRGCRAAIAVGERVWWRRGDGTRCAACGAGA